MTFVSDPFKLADALNITILERGDFKRQQEILTHSW